MSKLVWEEIEGSKDCAPLSCSGHYVISHRFEWHTVSYRPPGQRHHVGSYATPELATDAAEEHYADLILV